MAVAKLDSDLAVSVCYIYRLLDDLKEIDENFEDWKLITLDGYFGY